MVQRCLAYVLDPISNLSEERSTVHFLRLIDGYHAGCPSTGNDFSYFAGHVHVCGHQPAWLSLAHRRIFY
jgi:hypothetical protein